jgi:hypothetical protein
MSVKVSSAYGFGVAVAVAVGVAVGDDVAVGIAVAVATGVGMERCAAPKRAATGMSESPSPATSDVAVVVLVVALAPVALAMDVLVDAAVVSRDAWTAPCRRGGAASARTAPRADGRKEPGANCSDPAGDMTSRSTNAAGRPSRLPIVPPGRRATILRAARSRQVSLRRNILAVCFMLHRSSAHSRARGPRRHSGVPGSIAAIPRRSRQASPGRAKDGPPKGQGKGHRPIRSGRSSENAGERQRAIRAQEAGDGLGGAMIAGAGGDGPLAGYSITTKLRST